MEQPIFPGNSSFMFVASIVTWLLLRKLLNKSLFGLKLLRVVSQITSTTSPSITTLFQFLKSQDRTNKSLYVLGENPFLSTKSFEAHILHRVAKESNVQSVDSNFL